MSQRDTLGTRTHNLDSDTIWIGPLTISSENQLVSNEGSQSLLWHSKLQPTRHVLRTVHMTRAALLDHENLNDD